jgi:DNA-binding MarR family transcriptional regulator
MLQAYKLIHASHYYIDDAKISLTATEKLILIKLDQIFFQTKDSDKPLKVTQRQIADAISIDLKATGYAIKRLIKNGLVGAARENENNFTCYKYYSVGGTTLYTSDEREIDFVLKVKNLPSHYKPLENSYTKPYYVYVCRLNGIPVYVGKGKGPRLLHCISGTSSNQQLNQALFEYGADALSVDKIHENLSDEEAMTLERETINSLKEQGFSLFNVA